MFRLSFCALLALASAASVRQSLPAVRQLPVSGPIRDAGVLHVATGTWTRRANAASLGLDVVYDNTCRAAYYSALSGDSYIDEGRLPSPSSPTSLVSRPGCAASYTTTASRSDTARI